MVVEIVDWMIRFKNVVPTLTPAGAVFYYHKTGEPLDRKLKTYTTSLVFVMHKGTHKNYLAFSNGLSS